MKYLLLTLAMFNIMSVSANVEKGTQPGTVIITQFGDLKINDTQRKPFPKTMKPARPCYPTTRR